MKKLHIIQKTFLIIMLFLSALILFMLVPIIIVKNNSFNQDIFFYLFLFPIALTFILCLGLLFEKKS